MVNIIEVIPVPKELDFSINGKLDYIKDLYQLQSVKYRTHELIIEGDKTAISSATKLCPGLLLAWKIKATKPQVVKIKLPKSVAITTEVLAEVIGDEYDESVVKLEPPTITISGSNDHVSSVKAKVDNFLNELKPKSRKRKNTEKTVMKSNHVTHPCMFCQQLKSSRHFREHCEKVCKIKTAMLFDLDERRENDEVMKIS